MPVPDLKLNNNELVLFAAKLGVSAVLAAYMSTPEDTVTEIIKDACTYIGGMYVARGAYSITNKIRETIVGPQPVAWWNNRLR